MFFLVFGFFFVVVVGWCVACGGFWLFVGVFFVSFFLLSRFFFIPLFLPFLRVVPPTHRRSHLALPSRAGTAVFLFLFYRRVAAFFFFDVGRAFCSPPLASRREPNRSPRSFLPTSHALLLLHAHAPLSPLHPSSRLHCCRSLLKWRQRSPVLLVSRKEHLSVSCCQYLFNQPRSYAPLSNPAACPNSDLNCLWPV